MDLDATQQHTGRGLENLDTAFMDRFSDIVGQLPKPVLVTCNKGFADMTQTLALIVTL